VAHSAIALQWQSATIAHANSGFTVIYLWIGGGLGLGNAGPITRGAAFTADGYNGNLGAHHSGTT